MSEIHGASDVVMPVCCEKRQIAGGEGESPVFKRKCAVLPSTPLPSWVRKGSSQKVLWAPNCLQNKSRPSDMRDKENRVEDRVANRCVWPSQRRWQGHLSGAGLEERGGVRGVCRVRGRWVGETVEWKNHLQGAARVSNRENHRWVRSSHAMVATALEDAGGPGPGRKVSQECGGAGAHGQSVGHGL